MHRADDMVDADLIVPAEATAWGVALAGTWLIDPATVAVEIAALAPRASQPAGRLDRFSALDIFDRSHTPPLV